MSAKLNSYRTETMYVNSVTREKFNDQLQVKENVYYYSLLIYL